MGILSRIEQRASLENPSTSLANPDTWLVEAFGGAVSDAGVSVNHSNALQISAVWACVNVLSQDVAKLPLITYRRLDRGKERAREHPLFPILHTQANPQMSSYNFRRTLQAHLATWGNAYAEIERNRVGDVIGLWPLLPDRTEVHRIGGEKVVITRVNGKDIAFTADNVLHIPGLGFDGLRGYSVISMAKQAIGGAKAAEKFGSQFFGNGARPGGVITVKGQLSEEAQARLRRSWDSLHQGPNNAQRVAILDEDMAYTEIGIPPGDAQFIQLRQHSVEEIVRFFRVPPHKVQHLLHAGVRANVESENISYVTDTLLSWTVNWEQEINRTLFSDEERATFFAEHNFEGLLRGDSATRAEFYQSGINNGWLSVNDVRELENLNPVEGGDRHFVPLNLAPLDMTDLEGLLAGDDDDDEPPPENNGRRTVRELRAARSVQERHQIMQAHKRGFARVASRVVGIEIRELRGLIKKAYGQRDSRDFMADVDRFYRDYQAKVEEDFAPLVASYADLIRRVVASELGTNVEPDPDYERFTSDYTEGMASRHVRKSQQQLQAIVRETPEEEQEAALNQRLDEWDEKRAGKIAQSETVRAMGALSKAAYGALGVLALVWRTIGDTCPYCRKLDGRTVGIRELFAAKGQSLDPDGEGAPMRFRANVGHPPAHGGCDCIIGAAF